MESLHLSHPYAIMMVGIPGSGKSFFASKFADTFNAPYIDSIYVASLCSDDATAGEMLSLLLAEITKTRQTFLFDGSGETRVQRNEFAQWARSRNYRPIFVWVQTDERTAKKRVMKAGVLSSKEFDDALYNFESPRPDEKPLVISGKHTQAGQARTLLAYLGRLSRQEAAKAKVPPVKLQVPTRKNVTIR